MTTAKTVSLIISVLTLLVGQKISAGTVETTRQNNNHRPRGVSRRRLRRRNDID